MCPHFEVGGVQLRGHLCSSILAEGTFLGWGTFGGGGRGKNTRWTSESLCLEVTLSFLPTFQRLKQVIWSLWSSTVQVCAILSQEEALQGVKPRSFSKDEDRLPQMGLQLVLIVSMLTYFGLVLCTAQICPGMFRFVCVSFDESINCLK